MRPGVAFCADDGPEKPCRLPPNFPPATREQWRKLVDAVLKGAPFERLVSTTYDGLAIEPLAARRSDARPVAGARRARRPGRCWRASIIPIRRSPTRRRCMNSATAPSGLALVFAGAVGDHGFGLPARAAALARVLEGVDLDAGIAIELDLSPPSAARRVDRRVATAAASGWSLLAARGRQCSSRPRSARRHGDRRRRGAAWSEAAPHFARRLAALARDGFSRGPKLAAADGRVIHNAGGSEAQELAFVLAVALAYLRALEAEGVALEAARRMIFFRLSADADQFLTIAKFRALRKLWARVEVSCGLDARAGFRLGRNRVAHDDAARSAREHSARDHRCVRRRARRRRCDHACCRSPPRSACPTRFARRIARNTQLILLEESHLAKVADPAAGSGAVEDLTDELCRAAWALFQEIEAAGGAAAALENGLIQRKVAAVRAERAAAVARRKDALTGVEHISRSCRGRCGACDALLGAAAQAAAGRVTASAAADPPRRAVRSAARCVRPLLAETGARPKIFLANLGTPADFTARATFAKNFFEAGGIEAVARRAAPDPDTQRATVRSALSKLGRRARLPVLIDNVYESEAATRRARLRRLARGTSIWPAGRGEQRSRACGGRRAIVYLRGLRRPGDTEGRVRYPWDRERVTG